MRQDTAKTSYVMIQKLAKEKTVERLANSYGLSTPYKADLCQDIYVDLMSKDQDAISGMIERGEIEWFIRKMITNNINSVTSPFYKKYEKFRKLSNDINEQKDKI